MLANPFFRLQDKEFFPDRIKDLELIFFTFESKGVFRKIEFLHTTNMLIHSRFTKGFIRFNSSPEHLLA